MSGPVKFKVCGLTVSTDAALAADAGADYLGFILHPGSPRHLSLRDFEALVPKLPARPKVAVSVEPSVEDLEAMRAAGFDFFQIHFDGIANEERLRAWSRTVGRERLWLAPRLAPPSDVPNDVLAAADCILLDTFQEDAFGGSGRTGDWEKFSRHQAAHPGHQWILAGGLNPENVAQAVRRTGAQLVDVSSGVEASPGRKDPAKVQKFAENLRRATGFE